MGPGVAPDLTLTNTFARGVTTGSACANPWRWDSLPTIEVDPRLDFRAAGELYRTARAGGHAVRSFVDCLIAAIAIRTDSTVVHRDHDFEVLAEVSSLTQERWG